MKICGMSFKMREKVLTGTIPLNRLYYAYDDQRVKILAMQATLLHAILILLFHPVVLATTQQGRYRSRLKPVCQPRKKPIGFGLDPRVGEIIDDC